LAAAIAAPALGADLFILYSGCSEGEAVIAQLGPEVRVQVHSAMAGESKPCYYVAAAKDGKPVRGYLLGTTHPAVVEFERLRRSGHDLDRTPPPAPAGAQATMQAQAAPGAGGYFENISGVDTAGRSFNLAEMRGKVVLVTFWAPGIKASRSELDRVRVLYEDLHGKGLNAISVSIDPNRERVAAALDDSGVDWPVYIDYKGLAQRHDVARGNVPKTFVLGPDRQILASGLRVDELKNIIMKEIGKK
jgi:peroxiredoxin